MKRLTLCLLALSLSGCARFSTKQTDISYDDAGLPQRSITTTASATTFAASKSALAKWKASQTDKSQGAEVGGLDQAADASNLVKAAVDAAVGAAVKAAK